MSRRKKHGSVTAPVADGTLALRLRAQAQLQGKATRNAMDETPPSALATQELVHEMQARQVELEMQNDALRQTSGLLDCARSRYFDLYDHAPVGYVTVTEGGLIHEANLTVATLLGVVHSALLMRALSDFVGPQDQHSYALMCQELQDTGKPQTRDLKMTRTNGSLLWVHLLATLAVDKTGVRLMRMVLSDINMLKSSQSHLEHLAYYDALTNLPNRLLKADRLQQAMVQARRTGQGLAVVYIDLDGFKAVNDRHGHAAGDQLLVAVARNMQQVLREGDTLARIGGDEFVAVLINVADMAVCAPMLDRLLGAAAKPLLLGDEQVQVSASLGVTFYPQAQEVDGEQLLRQADHALYQAKQDGRNRYRIYDCIQGLARQTPAWVKQSGPGSTSV